MPKIPNAAIEAQALDETDAALRELCQAALNIGLSRGSLVLMLRKAANDYEPKIVHDSPAGLQ